jgi:lipoate-protein ligase B
VIAWHQPIQELFYTAGGIKALFQLPHASINITVIRWLVYYGFYLCGSLNVLLDMSDVESTFICQLMTTLVIVVTDILTDALQQLSEINRNARNNLFQLLKEGNGIV